MFKSFLVVPALFLLGAPAYVQQAPQTAPPAASQAAPYTIPPEWASKANPVTPTPQSQARAKQIYGWDCAACHGDNGSGKGDVAAEQKITMRDFRSPDSLKKLTDGEMYYIIHNGKGQMPSEGERAKPDEVWNLVIYLRKMTGEQTTATAQPPQ